jgi:tRNA-2-methylthio-N6-dimethylallyladenosine synthase
LVALQEEISWDQNKRLIGTTAEVLISAGEGRKDTGSGRLSGRARDGRLVHLASNPQLRPGDIVHTTFSSAAPYYLLADGPVTAHRRTRAGDAWEAGQVPRSRAVGLPMPGIGAPAPVQPVPTSCPA